MKKTRLYHALLPGLLLTLLCLLPITGFAVTAGWTQIGGCEWQIATVEGVKTLTIRPLDNGTSGNLGNATETDYDDWAWYSKRSGVKSIVINPGVKATKTLHGIFSTFTNLVSADVANLDTSATEDFQNVFSYCYALQSLDLSQWNTSNATDMLSMFAYCTALKTLTLSENFKTSKVAYMNQMFNYCPVLESLDLSSFDTANVTMMNYMFAGCYALQSLDLSGFDTAKVKNMGHMFEYCTNLQSLDISNFDSSSLLTVERMFENCKSLASLNFPAAFDIANVSATAHMFYNCSSLQSLDLSNFNTAQAGSMDGMFCGCSSLKSLKLSPAFVTTGLFNDFIGFYMYGFQDMFSGCSSLKTLDLSSFTTFQTQNSNRTNYIMNLKNMFKNCSDLETIYVDSSKWAMDDCIASDDMFTGCIKLVGGRGTSYDSRFTDKTYAVVDYGTVNPGYLSKRADTLTFAGVAGGVLTREIGEPYTEAATGVSSAITYTCDNPAVATINSKTGEVTMLSIGTAVITASSEEDGTHYPMTASYTLNVVPEKVTPPSTGDNTRLGLYGLLAAASLICFVTVVSARRKRRG